MIFRIHRHQKREQATGAGRKDDSNLKLTRGESGDVRLEANTFGGKEASVTHAGSIDAHGDVFLSAKSTGFNNYHTDEELKQPYINDTTDFNAAATAKVVVRSSGRIKADGDVNLNTSAMISRNSTQALNYYTNWAVELFNDLGPLNFDGSFTSLKSVSNVAVESGAKLEALGSMKLQAESVVGAKVGTSLGFRELIKYANSDTIPAAAAVVSIESGSATVVVDGELSSGGNMDISAAELSYTTMKEGKEPSSAFWPQP